MMVPRPKIPFSAPFATLDCHDCVSASRLCSIPVGFPPHDAPLAVLRLLMSPIVHRHHGNLGPKSTIYTCLEKGGFSIPSPRSPRLGHSVSPSGSMLFSRIVPPGLLPVLLSRVLLTAAAPAQRDLPPDPCAKIAGLLFVDPADAIACQKSFPFDENLQQNVMSVVSRVFDFYTFEDFYYNSPAPFQESTKDIRGEIARISGTQYAVRILLCAVHCDPAHCV